MKKGKVSIVVPVYNAAKYLEKCLSSIIKQSYQDIEIILIDDGSSDNSNDICNNYAKNDNRIIVIKQKNSGVSIARNNGIKATSGEYLCFIDSDDLVHPDYVKNLVSNVKDNTLTVCQIQTFSNDVIIDKENNGNKIVLEKNQFIQLCSMHLLNTPCCKLYNIDIIKKNKILFDTKLSLGEDLLFNLDYMEYIDKMIVNMQKLYYYRKEENNTLSTAYNPKMFDIQILLFDKYTEFFKNDKMDEDELCIFDSYRFSTLQIIVENEFRNKKIGFWQRYFKVRKIVENEEMQKRLDTIHYLKKKLLCYLLRHKLILLYKIVNKIGSI